MPPQGEPGLEAKQSVPRQHWYLEITPQGTQADKAGMGEASGESSVPTESWHRDGKRRSSVWSLSMGGSMWLSKGHKQWVINFVGEELSKKLRSWHLVLSLYGK